MLWCSIFALGILCPEKGRHRGQEKTPSAQICSSFTFVCPSWLFRMSTLFFMQWNPGKSGKISHWLEKAWRRRLNKHFSRTKSKFIFSPLPVHFHLLPWWYYLVLRKQQSDYYFSSSVLSEKAMVRQADESEKWGFSYPLRFCLLFKIGLLRDRTLPPHLW